MSLIYIFYNITNTAHNSHHVYIKGNAKDYGSIKTVESLPCIVDTSFVNLLPSRSFKDGASPDLICANSASSAIFIYLKSDTFN
jgi:hypothetical protein